MLKQLRVNDLNLAFVDHSPLKPDGRPLLFIHGWCCEHTVFAAQIGHFKKSRRTVAIDLRGHGASATPGEAHTVEAFIGDIVAQIQRLELCRPVVVGHSMGGNIALQLAAVRPDLVSAVMLIDTMLFPGPELMDMLQPALGALGGERHGETVRAIGSMLFIATDDPVRKERLLTDMSAVPPHVAASALASHILDYDAEAFLSACTVPIAYIRSRFDTDPARLARLRPELLFAQTLGSGHFSPLEVPLQINAMLERFLATL